MAMVAAIHLWVARKGDSSVRLILRVFNAGRFEVGLEFAGGARFSEMFASRIDAENAAAQRRGELESRGWRPVGAHAAVDPGTSIPSFVHIFESSSPPRPGSRHVEVVDQPPNDMDAADRRALPFE